MITTATAIANDPKACASTFQVDTVDRRWLPLASITIGLELD